MYQASPLSDELSFAEAPQEYRIRPAQSTTPPARRLPACERCHHLKMSCSKTSPCSRCTKAGVECIERPHQKTGRKVKPVQTLANYDKAIAGGVVDEVSNMVPSVDPMGVLLYAMYRCADHWRQQQARVSGLIQALQGLSVEDRPAIRETGVGSCPGVVIPQFIQEAQLVPAHIQQQLIENADSVTLQSLAMAREQMLRGEPLSFGRFESTQSVAVTQQEADTLEASIANLPLPALYILFTPDFAHTVRTYANTSAARLLGYEHKDLLYYLNSFALMFMLYTSSIEEWLHLVVRQLATSYSGQQRFRTKMRKQNGDLVDVVLTVKTLRPNLYEAYFVPENVDAEPCRTM